MNQAVAIKRRALSRPVRAALAAGVLSKGLSYFDYGQGRGDDVRLLRRKGYKAQGWDPHHGPQGPKRAADVVGLVYVLNIIPSKKERTRALLEAASLARRYVLVAVRTDKAQGEPYRDGVRTAADTFQANFDHQEILKWLRAKLPGRTILELEPGVFAVAMFEAAPIKPNKRRHVAKRTKAYYDGDRSRIPRGYFLEPDRDYPYRTPDGRIDCNLLSGAIKRARMNKARGVKGADRTLKKGLALFKRVCAKYVNGATQ